MKLQRWLVATLLASTALPSVAAADGVRNSSNDVSYIIPLIVSGGWNHKTAGKDNKVNISEEPGHTPAELAIVELGASRSGTVDARLLVARETDGTDVIEIVHECLADRWDRLARWRSEDAADRALLGEVRAATRRWLDADRRPDLLWRGEALAELRKLVARSTALTGDERAFASAAERAARRSRRIRSASIIAAMASLGAIALVMAYLSFQANDSRSAAERSAGEARESARLAEERLTSGLIAQGRRELNDNRGLAALAYFAEALRRGADTPGLRTMISLAARGLREERLVTHDYKVVSITALPSGFAAGDLDGRIHFYDADARATGEVTLEIESITALRARGTRLLAIGRSGVAVLDASTHDLVARIATEVPASSADLGPGADEVTISTSTGLVVRGLDGAVRRKLDRDLSRSDTEPVWGDGHVFLAIGTTIIAVDLRAMKERTIADDVYAGPGGSADGSTVVYVDTQRRSHVLEGDGRPRTIFTSPQRTEMLYVSMTGDRIGAISERMLEVHDRDGKELRTVPLSPQDEELLIRIRDDDVWTGSTHGVLRRYHAGVLVASLPTHTTEIEDIRFSGDNVISIGFDATVVVDRASAAHFLSEPGPCEAGSYAMFGAAMSYVCEDGRTLIYAGQRRLGELRDHALAHSALEPGSGRSAVSGQSLSVFDAAGKLLVTATGEDHTGPLAFEDADHLLVVAGDEKAPALMRLAIPTTTWTRVATLTEPTGAIAHVRGGIMLGGKTSVLLYRDGRIVHRVTPGDGTQFLSVSGDRRYASANLDNGGTLILDGETGEIVRRFEPVESFGVAAILDAAGDLVMRTNRGTLTIWERATGDNLVWNLEFLHGAYGAAFRPDGRIETVGERIGLLDIPRDPRPVAEILADIECRVPLKVTGSRLDAAPTRCPHKESP